MQPDFGGPNDNIQSHPVVKCIESGLEVGSFACVTATSEPSRRPPAQSCLCFLESRAQQPPSGSSAPGPFPTAPCPFQGEAAGDWESPATTGRWSGSSPPSPARPRPALTPPLRSLPGYFCAALRRRRATGLDKARGRRDGGSPAGLPQLLPAAAAARGGAEPGARRGRASGVHAGALRALPGGRPPGSRRRSQHGAQLPSQPR